MGKREGGEGERERDRESGRDREGEMSCCLCVPCLPGSLQRSLFVEVVETIVCPVECYGKNARMPFNNNVITSGIVLHI